MVEQGANKGGTSKSKALIIDTGTKTSRQIPVEDVPLTVLKDSETVVGPDVLDISNDLPNASELPIVE